MTHKGTLPLETERLILRRFTESDTEAMFKNWASDPEVTKYLVYDTCTTLDETKKRISEWFAYLENYESDVFAIVLKETDEIIGTIDFAVTDADAKSAEVGYQLGKAWWGKGHAAEALNALIYYLFESVGLNRSWADYDSRNPNSGRVMQKAGLVYEGTSRQCKIRSGDLVDRVYYAILAEDYLIANMETTIRTILTDEPQALALDFIAHLRSNGVVFERGGGYWADKFYWYVKYRNEFVGFILINGYSDVGDTTEPEGWIFWSDNYISDTFAEYKVDERTKEIAYNHVDIGTCGGGIKVNVFGKEFYPVCNGTTFRFNNPNAEEIECAKKLIEIRIKDIVDPQK
jgi:ribosomal-protein-alanine N-acetyltransferase